jgi:hypothetical protein
MRFSWTKTRSSSSKMAFSSPDVVIGVGNPWHRCTHTQSHTEYKSVLSEYRRWLGSPAARARSNVSCAPGGPCHVHAA